MVVTIQVILSFIISIIAIVVAVVAYLISKRAYGIQSFSRYFDINNFVMKNWETLSAFAPLGQCKSDKEAIIRLFLFHRLNRFKLEKERAERKQHLKFSKMVFGKNIQNFGNILKDNGASEEIITLAIRILKDIRTKETAYFSDKFWNEFFEPDYFIE